MQERYFERGGPLKMSLRKHNLKEKRKVKRKMSERKEKKDKLIGKKRETKINEIIKHK